MVAREAESRDSAPPGASPEYPLKHTTSVLNKRLGLYLSEGQQRGFAAGLLVGTALGAAFLVWNLMGYVRRKN